MPKEDTEVSLCIFVKGTLHKLEIYSSHGFSFITSIIQ
jgi:hypothetical protein